MPTQGEILGFSNCWCPLGPSTEQRGAGERPLDSDRHRSGVPGHQAEGLSLSGPRRLFLLSRSGGPPWPWSTAGHLCSKSADSGQPATTAGPAGNAEVNRGSGRALNIHPGSRRLLHSWVRAAEVMPDVQQRWPASCSLSPAARCLMSPNHCYCGHRRTLSLLAQPSECGVAHDKAPTVTGASF